MQTQEIIEYDVKTLLQTVLDAMKSLRHTDNEAHPKPAKPRQMHAFQSKNQTKSERE